MSIEACAEPARMAQRLPYEPRATLGPATTIALSLVIIAVAALANIAAFMAILAMQGEGLGALSGMGATSFSEPSAQMALIASSIAGQVAAIALCIWFAGFKGGRRGEVLALGAPAGGLKAYLLAMLAFAGVAIGAGLLIDQLFPHDTLEDLKIWLPLVHSPWAPLLFILIVVGAPVSEELLFRGFLFPALARTRMGLAGAAIVSSLLWTLPHAGYSIQGLATIFIAGLVLAAILVRTGSLRVTIVCHAVYNAGAFLFMAFFMPIPGA